MGLKRLIFTHRLFSIKGRVRMGVGTELGTWLLDKKVEA